jgi:hypothetical protein
MLECSRCHKKAIIRFSGWKTYTGSVSKGPSGMNVISGHAPVTYCPECNTAIVNLCNEYNQAMETAYQLKKNSSLPPEQIKEQVTNILVPIRSRIGDAYTKDGFDLSVVMDMTNAFPMRYAEVFELIPK